MGQDSDRVTMAGFSTQQSARTLGPVVFGADAIDARVRALGEEISGAYAPEDALLVVGVLKGAFVFMADLVRQITLPLHTDFLVASSYGDRTVSSGRVQLLHDLVLSMDGRSVLLVEDIVDSGTTLEKLIPRLKERGARRVDVCALLHKKAASTGIEPRWVGFDAPNDFLVGYGLDLAEDFRHLPYIASL